MYTYDTPIWWRKWNYILQKIKIKKKSIALLNIYICENIYSTILGILSSWYHALVLKINYNKKYSWTFKIGAVCIWGRNTKSVHVSIFPMEVLASSRRRRRWGSSRPHRCLLQEELTLALPCIEPEIIFHFLCIFHHPPSLKSTLKWFALMDFVFIFAAVLLEYCNLASTWFVE